MADINTIVNLDSYKPNPVLGGGFSQGITIDPSPIEKLAAFTYYRDQNLWQQKQKDDFMAAKQIADIAAYDTTSPFKQYTEDLTKQINETTQYLRDNPNVLKYDPKHPEKYIEVYKKIGDLQNKRTHATANDVLYNAAKSQIELIPDSETRDREKRRLDLKVENLFADGVDAAYSRQFEATPPPKPQQSIIPTAASTTRSILVPLPNSDVINEVTYTDVEDLMAKSVMRAAGGDNEEIKNQDWFKKLSPKEQAIELETATSTQRQDLEKTAGTINTLLTQWQVTNPGVDLNVVDVTLLPNNSFFNNIRSARSINDQIDELNSLIAEGKIKDPSGAVRTTPYEKLNLNDGVSSAELIFLKSIQDSKVPLIQKVEKKSQQNNNAIEKAQIAAANYREKLQQNGANYRANLPYEKMKLTASADAAKDFGNIIYGVNFKEGGKLFGVNGTAIINGAVVNKDGAVVSSINGDAPIPASALDNSIITEFNRYAGQTKLNAAGDVISSPVTTKLEADEDKNFIVRFENGVITGIKTSDGTYADVDQFQYITTMSSQKGATKYKKPEDISGGLGSDGYPDDRDPNNWKQEGNYYRYKDGRVFDANGKLIKK